MLFALQFKIIESRKYSSLKDILFLLKLNASNLLKDVTQELSLYILQSNINNCGKTISLKDLIFAARLNTITS